MQITVNDSVHDVPFDLSSITLGRFVDYYERYGSDLDKDLQRITEKDYRASDPSVGDDDVELNLAIDLDNHIDREALSWFSYWTGQDLFSVKDEPIIAPVLEAYRALRFCLKESLEEACTLPMEHEWEGELWQVKDFCINPASDMSFNEIITSKEVVRQVHALGKGRWSSLPYLCAVFFRKKDEPFTDELVTEGGERMELLQSLPMDYAVEVAFFLSNCVSIWSSTLQSSKNQAVETQPQK